MILSTLLFSATLIIGTTLVATFWNDITKWLRKVVPHLKKILNATIYGFKIFIKKIGNKFQEISEHYSKYGLNWKKTTVTQNISASEVPEEIRVRAEYGNIVDITDEYEQALEV